MKKKSKFILVIALSLLAWLLYTFYTWQYQSLPQAATVLLKNLANPKSSDTILIFSPHPDDETIALGGYIKTATTIGAKVYIVLVTDGNKHHLEKIRYNEFAKATFSLGVPETNLTYLNFPDGSLNHVNSDVIESSFRHAIAKIKPTIVFLPHPKDRHPDHATTSVYASIVLTESKAKTQNYYYLVHFPHFPVPSGLHRNMFITPPMKLLEFSKEWLNFPLSTDVENTKESALKMYRSQQILPPLRELIPSFIRKNEIFEAAN